jgi:hypothetical protein
MGEHRIRLRSNGLEDDQQRQQQGCLGSEISQNGDRFADSFLAGPQRQSWSWISKLALRLAAATGVT